MPSFQSPVPISGRPCAPVGEAEIEAARAMLEQRRRLVGAARLEVEIVLAGRRAGPSRNGTRSSRIAAIARRLDIVRGDRGEPRPVVGDARADALAGGRQPPMLDVALDELPRRRAQQMCSRVIAGRATSERHDVLQLVAEAVGAARLIEGRARPVRGRRASDRAASRSA